MLSKARLSGFLSSSNSSPGRGVADMQGVSMVPMTSHQPCECSRHWLRRSQSWPPSWVASQHKFMVLRSGCGQGWFLLRMGGRICLGLLPNFWGCAGYLRPSSAVDALRDPCPHAHRVLPLCLPLSRSPLVIDTNHVGPGPFLLQ